MKQIFNRDGAIIVEDVPAPVCGDNEILVKNAYSLISAGTESASLHDGSKGVASIASRAITKPQLVSKALAMVRRDGLERTIKAAKGQTGDLTALGYSSSGFVLAVGKNINDISIGDKVACAGAGYANHAEIIRVPKNLACKVPDGVDLNEAAFSTVGAIAMQGVRRAQVQFGDNVAVVGLGLLGLIACQILKAAGANVIGIDPVNERLELAKVLGCDRCILASPNVAREVIRSTDMAGADSVIIYAATNSSDPVKQAMEMARKKAKIVVVGAVGMDLDRSPFYEKELDFLISCSYGPGRYDPVYEEKGVDYPLGYVRWTENRNMQEFLRMLSKKTINVKLLMDYEYAVEDAALAYSTLRSETRPIGVLFKYDPEDKRIIRKTMLRPLANGSGQIKVAVIGAGGFARAYHLPNLKKIPTYKIRAIVSQTGNKARNIAEEYGAEYCTTDYHEVLDDPDVDMVLIATRHDLHAHMVIDAAKAGKQIFVEKPIAMTYVGCKAVQDAVAKSGVNLAVGFNRRFSPLAQKAKRIAEKRRNPLMITFRVNSAGMKKEHWINDPIEGGGAIIGEGCHFFDFCNWMVGIEPKRIYAEMISPADQSVIGANNIICTIKYEDGSVGSVVYTTIGSEAYPKERVEMFVDGGVMAIEDFRELTIAGLGGNGVSLKKTEKGQLELMEEYGKFLMGKRNNLDIPGIDDGVNATSCSLKVLDSLKNGRLEKY